MPTKITKLKKSFTIMNSKGLHTRPATEIVKCAQTFKSQIHLIYQGRIVNAKFLLGILMLAVPYGSTITVEAEGHDAEKAIDAMIDLANNKFNIEY